MSVLLKSCAAKLPAGTTVDWAQEICFSYKLQRRPTLTVTQCRLVEKLSYFCNLLLQHQQPGTAGIPLWGQSRQRQPVGPAKLKSTIILHQKKRLLAAFDLRLFHYDLILANYKINSKLLLQVKLTTCSRNLSVHLLESTVSHSRHLPLLSTTRKLCTWPHWFKSPGVGERLAYQGRTLTLCRSTGGSVFLKSS